MATVYVDSNATGANDGTSWTDAWTDIASSYGIAANSLIFIANNHSQDKATAFDLYWTFENHTMISATTGTAYSRGATLSTSSGAAMSWRVDGTFKVIGVNFYCDDDFYCNAWGSITFEDCNFRLTGGNAVDRLDQATAAGSWRFHNCRFRFSHADQRLKWRYGPLWMSNCSIEADGTAVNALIEGETGSFFSHIDNCDFSGMATSASLFKWNNYYYQQACGHHRASGVLLPTTGSVHSIVWSGAYETRVEAYSVAPASGATIADMLVEDGYGKAEENTSVYKAATYDGSTGYSIKITPKTTSANWIRPFRFKLFEDYLAANPTLKFHIVHDGSTDIKDNEVWLEIEHPNSTNAVQRSLDVTSRTSTPIGGEASLTTGSSTGWTTTGLSTPVYDEISETLTSSAGVVIVTICVAFQATTPVIYVDPEPDIT